jgi:Predicted type IV restriction endonuclease
MNDLNDPGLRKAISEFHRSLTILEQALRRAFPDAVDQPSLRIISPPHLDSAPKRRERPHKTKSGSACSNAG